MTLFYGHEVDLEKLEPKVRAEIAEPVQARVKTWPEGQFSKKVREAASAYYKDRALPVFAKPSMIPLREAVAAHSGTSFVPERRGLYRQREFASSFNHWARGIFRKYGTENEVVNEKVAEALGAYRGAYMAMLGSAARTTSWMITGRSGRNARREQKKSDTATRRSMEVTEILPNYTTYVRKALRRAEIEAAGGETAWAKGRQEARVEGATEAVTARAHAERAARLEALQSDEAPTEHTIPATDAWPYEGEVEYDREGDRIRVTFDSRLSKEHYKAIRARGFNYSRKFGSFGRKATNNTVYALRQVTGDTTIPFVTDPAKVKAASDKAAADLKAKRKAKKDAARAGEGSLQDVLAAAMKKRSRFKLGKVTPGIRKFDGLMARGGLAWTLSYKTDEPVEGYGYRKRKVPGYRVLHLTIGVTKQGKATVYQLGGWASSKKDTLDTFEFDPDASTKDQAEALIKGLIAAVKAIGLDGMSLSPH